MGTTGAPGTGPLDADCRRRLRDFALRLTGDLDLAEDVAQETIIRALREEVPTDLPYLFRVALNLVRSEARRVKRRKVLHEALVARGVREEPEPFDHLAAGEQKDRLWECLGRLPDRERTALVLRFGEGMSCTEIAAIQGTSPNAVSCLIRRGKERMRDLLDGRRPA